MPGAGFGNPGVRHPGLDCTTSELIALRWQDVDLAKQCIYVRVAKVRGIHKTTKTQAGMRQVTLQPEALAALLDQQTLNGADEIVFHNPRTNQPWHNDQAIRKTVWTPALQRANVKYRTPYPNPPHLRFHAPVTRRKPPMGRQPNGPQGLGNDQKSLWALDCIAIMNSSEI